MSHSLLGHDDSQASTEESGGKSKMLIIGGAVAAVAAIAAVVVFVVKPFGGSAAVTTPPAAAAPAATGTLSIDSAPRARVFIDETPKGTTPLRLDLPPGVHRVRVEADGGLAKTLEVNVVAGKEIAQLVELTKTPTDRAAERAAAAAAAAAAPPPPRRAHAGLHARRRAGRSPDCRGRAPARLVGLGQGRARPAAAT